MKQQNMSLDDSIFVMENALATLRLEGLQPDQETQQLMVRVAHNEITSSEAIEALNVRYGVQG